MILGIVSVMKVDVIVTQCAALGIAFHFKQWGDWAPVYALCRPTDPTHLIGIRRDGTSHMSRVGKKVAGRLLDGREHNGFPTILRMSANAILLSALNNPRSLFSAASFSIFALTLTFRSRRDQPLHPPRRPTETTRAADARFPGDTLVHFGTGWMAR
jgi:hypothetical protein